jgi:hypothetical protein
MAPAIPMVAPGCCFCFGSLEFVANHNGELGLRTATTSLQAIRFGSLHFVADDTSSMHLLTDEEVAAPVDDIPLSFPGLLPRAHYVAMADVYPEDGVFTSRSEDEEE